MLPITPLLHFLLIKIYAVAIVTVPWQQFRYLNPKGKKQKVAHHSDFLVRDIPPRDGAHRPKKMSPRMTERLKKPVISTNVSG